MRRAASCLKLYFGHFRAMWLGGLRSFAMDDPDLVNDAEGHLNFRPLQNTVNERRNSHAHDHSGELFSAKPSLSSPTFHGSCSSSVVRVELGFSSKLVRFGATSSLHYAVCTRKLRRHPAALHTIYAKPRSTSSAGKAILLLQ